MIQIKQTTQTTFSSISLEDAIVMVPLMDQLAEKFCKAGNEYAEKLQEPEEKGSEWDYDRSLSKLYKEYVQLGYQIYTLEKLGFRTSVPGMVDYDPGVFPDICSEL